MALSEILHQELVDLTEEYNPDIDMVVFSLHRPVQCREVAACDISYLDGEAEKKLSGFVVFSSCYNLLSFIRGNYIPGSACHYDRVMKKIKTAEITAAAGEIEDFVGKGKKNLVYYRSRKKEFFAPFVPDGEFFDLILHMRKKENFYMTFKQDRSQIFQQLICHSKEKISGFSLPSARFIAFNGSRLFVYDGEKLSQAGVKKYDLDTFRRYAGGKMLDLLEKEGRSRECSLDDIFPAKIEKPEMVFALLPGEEGKKATKAEAEKIRNRMRTVRSLLQPLQLRPDLPVVTDRALVSDIFSRTYNGIYVPCADPDRRNYDRYARFGYAAGCRIAL